MKIYSSLVFLFGLFFFIQDDKPVLYIIGDSTVRNGDGTGSNGQWGWGSFVHEYFDTTRIRISNQAIGGRSSRTFITEGRWANVLSTLKKGDYVVMQFGHNDAGPLDDTARARGSIRGITNDSVEIYNPVRKMKEVVRTYGWYMRKYVREVKAKGAVPIICSPVPRNNWEGSRVTRSNGYATWARQIAEEEGAFFVDLNEFVSLRYEVLGQAKVETFFHGDHTHTGMEGAKLNTVTFVDLVRKQKIADLEKYLIP